MHRSYGYLCCLVLLVFAIGSACVRAAEFPGADDTPVKPALQPAVAALLRASTAAYQKMQSYQHTAEYLVKTKQGANDKVVKDTAYTLALERPNKFCYRSDDANETAAVSDGKLYTNYKGDEEKIFTRVSAPASYKDINIVDDVDFRPIGTYLIALMLQGDVLADRDVRAAMEAAPAPGSLTEDGKRYDTLSIKFGKDQTPLQLYFDPQTHLLHKTVLEEGQARISEIIENVKIDKPISPAIFEYTPPRSAQWIAQREHGVQVFRCSGVQVPKHHV